MAILYGDGIHDDFQAIQEMIDSGVCEVALPAPKVKYMISQTLTIPSNFRLVLPRYAEIVLTKGANCPMVRNKRVLTDFYPEDDKRGLWDDVFRTSLKPEDTVSNFEICGGIWNCNNLEQVENPIWTRKFEPVFYSGFGMMFCNVKNFRLTDMTIKDPVNFAVTLDTASYFTVDHITFDYNYGNPMAVNMDGIHLNGNCHYAEISNLKGTCYDDLVALNADEGSGGPITHIDVHGLHAENCHSAARLLTVKFPVEHIHISDVHGTYYQYCIGLTKYYPGATEGWYDCITFDNIYASKAERLDVYRKKGSYVYPLIWAQGDTVIRNLKVHTLHRREYDTPVETFYVGPNAVVENMILENVTTVNHTADPMPLLVNKGRIKRLAMRDIRTDSSPMIQGDGIVEHLS